MASTCIAAFAEGFGGIGSVARGLRGVARDTRGVVVVAAAVVVVVELAVRAG